MAGDRAEVGGIEPARGARRTIHDEVGTLDATAREGVRAARVERAAGRNGGETRQAAVDLIEPCLLRANRGNRAHEPDGVGMSRVLDDVAQRSDLGDATRV